MKMKEREKILRFCRKAVKAVSHEGHGDTNCNRYAWKKGIRNQRRIEYVQTRAILKSAITLIRFLDS